MKDDRPSFTAAWVAACRALGALLPSEARLADDPHGGRFAGAALERLSAAARRNPLVARAARPLLLPVLGNVLWMQLRTRVLDDLLLQFVRDGGRQVVLLGAGFDSRAERFRGELSAVTVFEVDHPATQARKRRVLAATSGDRVVYVPWDFERSPMAALPARLASQGHDPGARSLTIWEGVTMYLSEPAIVATADAVRRLSASGSLFAFTYFDRAQVEHPRGRARLVAWWAARMTEPFRFGWRPGDLPGWLATRGFALLADRSDEQLARLLLPRRYARRVRGDWRHLAIAGVAEAAPV